MNINLSVTKTKFLHICSWHTGGFGVRR